MVDDDRNLIRQMISAKWHDNDELSKKWLSSSSEQRLRGICLEIDHIISDSMEKVSRLNAEIKDNKKLYLLDEVQLLALQHVRMTIQTEITMRNS
ncbi:hypothetical protein [Paenibacillus periandrae]|uniref:hypothetical protein n=1 Tax=Paenibacillus periandrae TaxID=1761741 RepID=UPI001F095246|nr:hypothetical protein [Paenibacillus periandrae]